MRSTPTASSPAFQNSSGSYPHKGGKRDACGLTTKGSGLSIILCFVICVVIVLTAIFYSAGQAPVPSRTRPDLSGLAEIGAAVTNSPEAGEIASEASSGLEGFESTLQGGKLMDMAQKFISVFDEYVKSIADESADEAITAWVNRTSPIGRPSDANPGSLGKVYFTGKCTGCPASWYQKCSDAPGGKDTDKVLGHRGCKLLGCELQCRTVFVQGPTAPPTPHPPTPPTIAPTPAPTKVGSCTNEKDHEIWETKAKAGFGDAMSKTGFKCMGAGPCMSSAIKEEFGFSESCATCFGDLGACTKKHCMFKCIGGASKQCNKCTRKNCVGPFADCSGIPKDQVPK